MGLTGPLDFGLVMSDLGLGAVVTALVSTVGISPTQFWPMQLGQTFAKFLQLGSSLGPFISGQNLMAHLAHL